MRGLIWSWLFIMCGCGSVKTPAASSPDAGPGVDGDPGEPADPSGTLKVVTQARFFVPAGTASGAGQSGVDVVSVQRDGTTIDGAAKSDADGHASLPVHTGGSVTAIYHHAADAGADLVTYFGVEPDDMITFGQRFSSTQTTSLGAMTFSFPSLSAANYQVFGPCGNDTAGPNQLSITLTELASCHVDPMDVVFVALNGAGQVIGYNYLNVAFHAGTTAPITTWATPRTAMLSITGLPAEVRVVNAVLGNVGNVDQRMFQFLVTGQATGGAYSNSFPWATTAVHTEAQLIVARDGNFQPIQLLDILQPDTTTWTVASAQLPPWLQTAAVSTADRTGSIFMSGDGHYDAAVVHIEWQHLMAGATIVSRWTFVLPPTMTSFAFPALPSELAAVLPPAADQYTTEAHLIEIPAVDGYKALRAIPEAAVMCPGTLVPDCSLRTALFPRVVFE
ncbi:MAG TPA: hypothetical protein VHW23_24235 [Kofleriaceae bacterium]|jgi:hypothetical protein|nr:hypothetical protein [Kofleriaceae bacterium]